MNSMLNDIQRQRREAIYLALAQIPAGKVITYGNLAKLAGLPTGARLAGRLICELPEETELPWHRVINAQGKSSLPPNSESSNEQIQRLKAEGIEIVNGKIPLKRYSF